MIKRIFKQTALIAFSIMALVTLAQAQIIRLDGNNINNDVIHVNLGDQVFITEPSGDSIHVISRVSEEAYNACDPDLLNGDGILSNSIFASEWILNILENSQELDNAPVEIVNNISLFYIFGPLTSNVPELGTVIDDPVAVCNGGKKFEIRIGQPGSNLDEDQPWLNPDELQARVLANKKQCQLNTDLNFLALTRGGFDQDAIADKRFLGGYQVASMDAEGRIHLKTIEGQAVSLTGYPRWSTDTVRWVEILDNGMRKIHSGTLTFIDPTSGAYAFLTPHNGAPYPAVGAGFSIDYY